MDDMRLTDIGVAIRHTLAPCDGTNTKDYGAADIDIKTINTEDGLVFIASVKNEEIARVSEKEIINLEKQGLSIYDAIKQISES